MRAWVSGGSGFVGATRNVVAAANGAHVILVSTDWVFDGTGVSTETTPANPINLYGMLKAASEQVMADGAIARISAVQGAVDAPRGQDAGFGYFVASLVEALTAGRPFTVWRDPRINGIATPTLATDAAGLIWRALERGRTGILHCCGGEHADREALARAAVDAFDLDGDLLAYGAPDAGVIGAEPIPYDTRLDATATAAALGVRLPDLRSQLERLRAQLETGRVDLEETMPA